MSPTRESTSTAGSPSAGSPPAGWVEAIDRWAEAVVASKHVGLGRRRASEQMATGGAGSSSSHLCSGAVAGFFATALLHPLDLIKTRFHVQEAGGRRLPHYRNLWDACRSIVRLEGWAGLYGGLWPNMLGNTASWGVYMYAYNRCKDELAARGHRTGSALYLWSATFAGALTTLLLHPVFMVKTRLQLQLNVAPSAPQAGGAGALPAELLPSAQRDNYRSAMNAVRRMVAEEGALSLYRGMGPSMLLVSHGTIQFLAYEHAKVELARRRDRSAAARSAGAARGRADQGVGALSARDLLLASTGSKVCAVLGTYPYQVVRSCMQQRAVVGTDALGYSTTADTVRHIWSADGARGFYRGIVRRRPPARRPRAGPLFLTRAAPARAVAAHAAVDAAGDDHPHAVRVRAARARSEGDLQTGEGGVDI